MYFLIGLTGLLLTVGVLCWGLEKVTDVDDEYHYVKTMTRIQDEDEISDEPLPNDELTLSTVKLTGKNEESDLLSRLANGTRARIPIKGEVFTDRSKVADSFSKI